MGQLERYGLYVLVVVIFLILGVAIMGNDGEPLSTRDELAVAGGLPDGAAFESVSRSDELSELFGPSRDTKFTPRPLDQEPDASSQPEDPPQADPRQSGSGETGNHGRNDAGTDPAAAQSPTSTGNDAPRREATPPRTHTVRRGDTFEGIAKRMYGDGTKWRAIAAANPTVDERRLPLGRELVIPSLPVEADAKRGDEPTAASAGVRHHSVQPGENFETIARRYYHREGLWQRIADANPGVEATRIQVGTKLVIPPLD